MMGRFNLADYLSADVSNSGTIREQIEYIDIDLIDDDPNNFYELSGIDELTANIELVGLQQPLRVRNNPEDNSRVILLSGHRRKTALKQLVAEGQERFRSVPCIREQAQGSAALQELRLIYANSDTRKMSSADLARQAERVEMLLYQLKEEGIEFPGRMRDHVAAACQMSKSKIARLKVIREKLIPAYKKYYDNNKLAESTAYALARLPATLQQELFDYRSDAYKGDVKKAVDYLGEWKVEDFKKANDNIANLSCTNGTCDKCTNRGGKLAKLFGVDYTYKSCATICCSACADLAICKRACPLLADKITKLKAEKKEARKEEKAATAEADRIAIELAKNIWQHFGEARRSIGKSAEEIYKAADMYYSRYQYSEDYENGKGEFRSTMHLPLPISRIDIARIVSLADALNCTVDYLLCRTDEPSASASEAVPTWRTGEPPEDGEYFARFDVDGSELIRLAGWRSNTKAFYFSASGATINAPCTGWYPIPKDKEDN